jgi:endonuclease YncB( thermonuclease family)
MSLQELETVVLERDLPEHGLRRGDLGAVVHVYDGETVEVEFVRLSGQTQAVVQLSSQDVRAVRDADLPAVRTAEFRRGAA